MNIPKPIDTIREVAASADIFIIPFFTNTIHNTNKSYANNNMPFLFNDLILFCISISPLQIEILDKPIYFFLQIYSIREYIG